MPAAESVSEVEEGYYKLAEGKNFNLSDRIEEQGMILKMLDGTFGQKQVMQYDEFLRATLTASSDLFFILLSILHTQLACSYSIFKLKKKI